MIKTESAGLSVAELIVERSLLLVVAPAPVLQSLHNASVAVLWQYVSTCTTVTKGVGGLLFETVHSRSHKSWVLSMMTYFCNLCCGMIFIVQIQWSWCFDGFVLLKEDYLNSALSGHTPVCKVLCRITYKSCFERFA